MGIIDLDADQYKFTTANEQPDDEVTLELIRETRKAFMVFNPDREEVAIPKSLAEVVSKYTVDHGDGDESDMLQMVLPEWVIERGNLK